MYKGTSFIDKVILFFSRGGYSHASVLFNDDTTIEAKPLKKVHRCNSVMDGLTCNTKIDIFEVYTTKSQDRIIKDFLTEQLGKSYDYLGIFGFILYTTEEKRKRRSKWFCSELVTAAFKKAGVNLLDRVDVWKVSPTILSYSTKLNQRDTLFFIR